MFRERSQIENAADRFGFMFVARLQLKNSAEISMTNLRLYSGPLSMFGAKVEIALHEKNLAYDLIMVPFTAAHRYEPKHPDVMRINPKGQVPVLIHGDVEIFDSTQIFEYLEDVQPQPALWPSLPAARAYARSLEHQSDEVYFPHIIRLMGLQQTPDDRVAVAARAGAAATYHRLENVIGTADYLAGAFTFADIAFFMAQFFGDRMGAPITDETPRLLAWRGRMAVRPAVQHVVGAMADYLRANGRRVPEWFMVA
jgi:glutathione S-transferase